MAIPKGLLIQIQQILELFCQARVPERVRNEVRLSFSVRGDSVTLFEERPRWNAPVQWISSKIAQFRYDHKTKQWSLHCRDRNDKWHDYLNIRPMKDFSVLLKEVDRDPTCIFWG